MPCPGKIESIELPGGAGVRVDTHVYAGYTIPSYYDSMIAKLIAHGPNRAAAIATLQQALAVLRLEGIATNTALHGAIMADPAFAAGGVDTNYLAGLLPRLAGGCP